MPAPTSPVLPSAATPHAGDYAWKALLIFSLYRGFLAGLFLFLDLTDKGPAFLGGLLPQLFTPVAYAYLGMAGFFLVLRTRRIPGYTAQVVLQVLVDIVALGLFMHASGGVSSGLGILMAVSVITGGLLLGGAVPLALAALATLFLLAEQVLLEKTAPAQPTAYSQAGMLGAVFFITTYIAIGLAQRMRESEALVDLRNAELASLQQLNEQIIHYMGTGVIAVDSVGRIRMINQSAWQFLGMPSQVQGRALDSISPALMQQLKRWRRDPNGKVSSIHPLARGPELMPNFVDAGADGLSLVFLQDTTAMTQQAQHLKLASLGRLTASIAHEIRNPLGAVSHAAQLLAESPELDPADRRLTDIIAKNSLRMNDIIENVLKLSHRKEPVSETLALREFVGNLAEELRGQRAPAPDIEVHIEPVNTKVRFDPSQLLQVLVNLSENGLRHSEEHCGRPVLALRGGLAFDTGLPFLDVIDSGEGINPEIAGNIFEPFFTTRSNGTGLGLYIARELCEANDARLDYLPIPAGGSCFRIHFAPPTEGRP
ncbi:MAG: hypothetical protein HYV16_02190 [Gammaproteobacteria bacterium]|nr:hypothetical protein [Gammaproteobacteria bacterium]